MLRLTINVRHGICFSAVPTRLENGTNGINMHGDERHGSNTHGNDAPDF
jgi:hypothetical protein